MTGVEKTVMNYINLLNDWKDNWSVLYASELNGEYSFCVRIETKYLDCSNLNIDNIELDGSWMVLHGRLK